MTPGACQVVEFTVIGKPEPQGSARAFYVKSLGRSVITSDNAKLKPWRQQVSGMAQAAMAGRLAKERKIPVRVQARFYFDRPQSAKKGAEKTTKPDLDKLLRALLDSMTGVVFSDDSQVTECTVSKAFGQPSRVEVAVTWADQDGGVR